MDMTESGLIWQPRAGRTLRDLDPGDTCGFKNKQDAKDKLCEDILRLEELQDVLNASAEYAVLIILQGMDAAGKDSAVKHVMSGVNPQGVEVHPFKEPTTEELRHDYLWRAVRVLPERGRIGIFNRSYYEDVLITRVHPELLRARLVTSANQGFWQQRYREINDFERYLTDNRTVILKFFLHMSKRKQAKRLLARLQKPEKHWKFEPSDLDQRDSWDDYVRAYEDALNATSNDRAPWYVVPADHKWVSHLVIADVIVHRLRALKLEYPKLPANLRGALQEAKRRLRGEASRQAAAQK